MSEWRYVKAFLRDSLFVPKVEPDLRAGWFVGLAVGIAFSRDLIHRTERRVINSTCPTFTNNRLTSTAGLSITLAMTASADYGAFFGEQLGFLVQNAKKHGVSTERIIEETSRALAPVVAGTAPEGFATREEGIEELLKEDEGTVPLSQATKLYRRPAGVTRQSLTEQIQKGKVIAYQSGQRGYAVAKWQFRPEGGLLPGLEEALKALRAHPGYGPLLPFTFFLQGHPVTEGRTPLQALREGKLDQVLAAIEADIR